MPPGSEFQVSIVGAIVRIVLFGEYDTVGFADESFTYRVYDDWGNIGFSTMRIFFDTKFL